MKRFTVEKWRTDRCYSGRKTIDTAEKYSSDILSVMPEPLPILHFGNHASCCGSGYAKKALEIA